VDVMRWGLVPFWAKDLKVGFSNINTKAEGIEGKPAFREAFQRRRCLVRCFQNNVPMGSCCIVDFVAPSVDHWLAIDVADEGDQAFLEFVFAADADVAQHRTRQLGEEALDEIEP